ncbi:MAG: hypothetical protein MUC96_00320 [Myxococcaceae bacterium]|jgi:hypothetical protein|nr:hypothetical protein [Myxococcaceae bacterium]
MKDLLDEFGNGFDGLVDRLEVRVERHRALLTASVVLHVARWESGLPVSWVALELEFTRLDSVTLRPDFLQGGGGVLYDGAMLVRSDDGNRFTLNLDPGTAWKATGRPKPEDQSSALLVGQCLWRMAELDAREA